MCPNIGECWGRGTATFLLMGDTCTRSCGFCKIKTGRPSLLDPDEPRRVGESVQAMGLQHAVLDQRQPRRAAGRRGVGLCREHSLDPALAARLHDRGADPGLQGDWAALQTVMDAQPEILNHNTETVPRLYRTVRPQAKYERSLDLLQRAKAMDAAALTKSGIMVGLGETMGRGVAGDG